MSGGRGWPPGGATWPGDTLFPASLDESGFPDRRSHFMKEIIALDETIRALALDFLPEDSIDFSRDEVGDGVALLPEEIQTRIASLQQAINAALPEDFDYFAFVGVSDEPPMFSLHYERMPAGGSVDGTFQPDRSLIEQLPEVNWEEQRAKAVKFQQTLDAIVEMNERTSGPLRSAKALQREFREEAREFIKEKRVDAGRIHVLYWDDEHELMEAAFDDGGALREALSGLIARGSEIITIIAWGKPLPVERIDTLKSEAQKTLRERLEAGDDPTGEEPGDGEQKPGDGEPEPRDGEQEPGA